MSCHVMFILLVTISLYLSCSGNFVQIKPQIVGPPLPKRPFVIVWNVPSEKCKLNFSIDLRLKDFDIVYNENKTLNGDKIVIFYEDQLGLYPHIKRGEQFNGGIPQLGNLQAHLDKAASDIATTIPDEHFEGLAVIDWEGWHANYDRANNAVYREKSIQNVVAKHPTWSKEEQLALAKFQFDSASRSFLESTLALGRFLRPHALWGYYQYPSCYNNDKTGKNLNCSDETLRMNDEIHWLFDDSTALYPSVYIGEWFKDKEYTADFVKNRILEARRIDGLRKGNKSVPILPYQMLSYRTELKLIDLEDLNHTIGIASTLGASGLIIWGGFSIAGTAENCQILSEYISNTFGPFCKKTSDAALKCSMKQCSSHGRCVVSADLHHRGSNGKRYLDKHEATTLIETVKGKTYEIYDYLLKKNRFTKQFDVSCQCYKGWTGNSCTEPEN